MNGLPKVTWGGRDKGRTRTQVTAGPVQIYLKSKMVHGVSPLYHPPLPYHPRLGPGLRYSNDIFVKGYSPLTLLEGSSQR